MPVSASKEQELLSHYKLTSLHPNVWPHQDNDSSSDDEDDDKPNGSTPALDGGSDVGLEEAGIDLGEDVAEGFAFVGEFEAEGGLEVGDEVRDRFCAEVGEVGEGEEEADVLGRMCQ